MFDTLSLLTLNLSRAYGMVIMVVALAALLKPARLGAVMTDFERSPGLTFLAALFTLILGLWLVALHSVWSDLPAILVSLLGWLVLIKAVLLLAAPEGLLKIGARASASAGATRVWGVIALIIGAIYLLIGLTGRATLSM